MDEQVNWDAIQAVPAAVCDECDRSFDYHNERKNDSALRMHKARVHTGTMIPHPKQTREEFLAKKRAYNARWRERRKRRLAYQARKKIQYVYPVGGANDMDEPAAETTNKRHVQYCPKCGEHLEPYEVVAQEVN
jgi:hypothetical protein